MSALRLENFSYAWPGAGKWTLRELCQELPQGECLWLSGASGSGKTTLALALKGLLPQGQQSGTLTLADASADQVAVGLVLQNPETQLLTESIGAEVAFGLENLCLPPDRMPARVRAALDAVGLDLPFDHATARLSMGQKYRLLLAAQLVLRPSLLVLDEPAGQLDDQGLRALANIIAGLKRQGLAVLLCEHRPGPLHGVIDRQWELNDSCRRLTDLIEPAAPSPRGPRKPPENDLPMLEVQGLTVAEADASPAWKEANLVLYPGERALLCAPNGAGKTTLLRCLAGLLQPRRGSIRICGQPLTENLCHRTTGYLFQNPRRQLFETTVFNEVAFGAVLERCRIDHLADCSPHRLSYGQQHLVALASVLAREPKLLLLDDPLAGLDSRSADLVMATLLHTSEAFGTTILWTSHHPPESGSWNHVTFGIKGERIVKL